MLSLVDYSDASSDEEQESSSVEINSDVSISKETEFVNHKILTGNPSINKKLLLPQPKATDAVDETLIGSDINSSLENNGLLNALPKPKLRESAKSYFQEVDDEFLKKSAVPSIKPPVKTNKVVRITIPSLSDFKDDLEVEKKVQNQASFSKGKGLLGILPKPREFVIQATTSKPAIVKKVTSLVPDSVKKREEARKKAAASLPQKNTLPIIDSDSDDEESSDFLSLQKEYKLPEVSNAEVSLMVAKKVDQIAKNKSVVEESLFKQYHKEETLVEEEPSISSVASLDQTAIHHLIGGNKAKRAKLSEVSIMEISERDIVPSKEEFMRTQLAQQTQFVPTGKLSGYESTSKRKSQITFLAQKALANEQELEAMWAANRQNKRAASSKYGF